MSTEVFPHILQTNIILSSLQNNASSNIYEDWYGLGNTSNFRTRLIWCLFAHVSRAIEMARTCMFCREKSKIRCDRCRNEFCQDHAIKCPKCGTITCIRDLNRRAICPSCHKILDICPECLLNGKIVRTIAGLKQCPECGWNG